MKAYEWAQRFRGAETLEQKVDVLDAYLDETMDLYSKRRNESAIREQRQKWMAMKVYDVEVFNLALQLCSQKVQPDQKHTLKLLKMLDSLVPGVNQCTGAASAVWSVVRERN